jgi:predicted MFS family arabinose efflux permease
MVVALGAWHVPESRDPGATGTADYPGAAAAVVALTGITSAFIEAPAFGWTSPAVLAMAATGAAGLAAFLLREHSAPAPMLPLDLFRVRQFAAANAVTFLVYGALAGVMFLLPTELQVGSGYSPLACGLALLPLTVIMLAGSARSGRLAARIGPRPQMSVGPVVTGAGLALLAAATNGSSYVLHVLPAVVVFALGLAITDAPLTATAMNSVPAQHSGIASAVNNDVARVGGLLAVAVLPALAGITGTVYLQPEVLAAGFRTAMLTAGAVCAAGGVVAAFTITNSPRVSRPGGTPPPAGWLHCGLQAPPLTTSAGNQMAPDDHPPVHAVAVAGGPDPSPGADDADVRECNASS